MENKVIEAEARSQAASELGGTGLEQQFAQLEGGSQVDDELAQLKAAMSGSSPQQPVLPAAVSHDSQVIDVELDQLKKDHKNS